MAELRNQLHDKCIATIRGCLSIRYLCWVEEVSRMLVPDIAVGCLGVSGGSSNLENYWTNVKSPVETWKAECPSLYLIDSLDRDLTFGSYLQQCPHYGLSHLGIVFKHTIIGARPTCRRRFPHELWGCLHMTSPESRSRKRRTISHGLAGVALHGSGYFLTQLHRFLADRVQNPEISPNSDLRFLRIHFLLRHEGAYSVRPEPFS